MKTLWTGSDVLYATKFPKHSKKSKWIYMFCFRIFAKIADIFCEQHYVVSEHLIAEMKPLKLKKRISVLVDPPLYTKKYKKVKHKGFNVLYYRGLGGNQKFKDWVYGKDIINTIELLAIPEINIIEVNGRSDMSKIYPITDFMVRPNRHDGNPRMVMECEINDIPYYWSKENPSIWKILLSIEKLQIQRFNDKAKELENETSKANRKV